jgi:hypothetical protein
VLEVQVAFSAIKRCPGPLVDSIRAGLLFGVLHWQSLRTSTAAMRPHEGPAPQ